MHRQGRLHRWGTGYISGGGGPRQAGQFFKTAEKVWQDADRPGKLCLVGCGYFARGPNARESVNNSILSYYTFLGAGAQKMADNTPSTPEEVRSVIQEYTDLGADEVMLIPCIPELDQVSRLADLVASV